MAEYETDDGRWVISSRQQWLPGSFATRKAARAAYKLTDENLYALAQTKTGLTSDDVRAALAAQRGGDGQ